MVSLMAFAGFLAVEDGTFKFYAAAADVDLFKIFRNIHCKAFYSKQVFPFRVSGEDQNILHFL